MSEIKVGSEWVSESGSGVATVKYVGEHKVFIKWNEDGSEGERFKELFLKNFKPAPVRRTVWLNVYGKDVGVYECKKSADEEAADGLLFQQEVELIDPREGEKG